MHRATAPFSDMIIRRVRCHRLKSHGDGGGNLRTWLTIAKQADSLGFSERGIVASLTIH
jgi:hypothetical protein